MAAVRATSPPDYFITFTCNSNWPESKDAVFQGQSPSERPDIVVRVFFLKMCAFMRDVLKWNYFGKVIGHSYVIEFQKRGLPHCHLLITMANEHIPKTTEICDRFISQKFQIK